MIGTRYPVTIEHAAPLALFEARGPERELAAALEDAGLVWPERSHHLAPGPDGSACLRLGPNRLLVSAPRSAETDLATRLALAFGRQETADAVDVSDMFAGYMITGAGAEDVLRQGAPLDLDAAVFPPGAMTGTELWGVAGLLGRTAEGFCILVDVAHGAFVEEWLAVAAGAACVNRPGTMIRPPARIRPKP